MPQVLVRNLPDDVHRALRMRAANHGRSTTAELRQIIVDTVFPGRAREQIKPPLEERLAALAREVDAITLRDSPDPRSDDEILGYNEHGVW